MPKFKKPVLSLVNADTAMESIDLDTCSNCIFWSESEMGASPEIGAPKAGRCGGLPPVPFPVMDQTGNLIGQRSVPYMTRADMPAGALFDPGEYEEGDGIPN